MPYHPAQGARRGAFARCFAAALLLTLAAAAWAVYLNAVSRPLFEKALLETVDAAALGTNEDALRGFAEDTLLFLTGSTQAWEPDLTVGGVPASRFISRAFRDHMGTVRGWVTAAPWVLGGAAAVAAGLLGWALAGAGRRGGFSMQGYYAGVAVPLALLAGVGVWAVLDFASLWKILHLTLIPDGIFPAGDPVMQLFPEALFSAYLTPVCRTLAIMLAALLALPLILRPVSLRIAGARARLGGTKR